MGRPRRHQLWDQAFSTALAADSEADVVTSPFQPQSIHANEGVLGKPPRIEVGCQRTSHVTKRVGTQSRPLASGSQGLEVE